MNFNTLRCKPGDLCLVIGGKHNSGKVVTTIRLATEEEIKEIKPKITDQPIWKVDTDLRWQYLPSGKIKDQPFIFDSRLLPINGLPEENEEQHPKEIPVS